MISRDIEIRLNRLAQMKDDLAGGVEWFRELDSASQADVLRSLTVYVVEAGGTTGDIPNALARTPLKPTHTPVVLLSKPGLKTQLAKLLQLPTTEHEKVFSLLIALFGVADDRRRLERCSGGCHHWWHHL